MNKNKNNIDNLKFESLVNQGKESKFFAELFSEVEALCQTIGIADGQRTLVSFEQLWLPVALNLAAKQDKYDRTYIQGILGGQGLGKTTLCKILQRILSYFGLATAILSIDDLYLTYGERKALQQQDPRLIWRGPPGTHDVALGLEILDRCRKKKNKNTNVRILMPRFDKSAYDGAGDRLKAESISQPDILLFEGWFVGVQPLVEYPAIFPKPIVTPEDREFARDNNQRLQDYLPLWDKLDSLIVLYSEDYHLSQQWRREAEQKMIATGRSGMSDEECDRFVEYFWKALHPDLYIKPLTQTADLVIEIKGDHTLGRIDLK
ncbi:MAG: glycerate kinase [Cyanobacteria bacterium J06600_6]